eukprot:161491_1
MAISCFILSLLIIPIFTKTIICNDTMCDFGICTNNKCTDNTYICTSSSTHCNFECENCNNITIISHAQDTNIFCGKNSCNKLQINIEPSELTTNYNSLLLTCGYSSSCNDIYISCDNQYNLCQCKDFNDIQCNNNVHGDFSNVETVTSIYTTVAIDDSDMDSEPRRQHSATDYVIYALFPALFCMLVTAGGFILMQGKDQTHVGNNTQTQVKQMSLNRPRAATIMSIISEPPKSLNSQTLETDIHTSDTTDIIYT